MADEESEDCEEGWIDHCGAAPSQALQVGFGQGWSYLIFVTDATDGVHVNFFGRCNFLQI